MASNRGEQLSGLVTAATAINGEALAAFGELTASQLNWKPSAEQWSVAQCFDHLLTANAAFFPTFDEILSGKKTRTFWERLPWLPGVWGKLLIRAVSPEAQRKLKAPKIFRPSSSTVDAAIIRRFSEQQDQVIRYMRASEGLDVERIKISSPVTRFITYSLLDAYRVIVTHERRHLLQATRVLKMDGFPQASR
ncbi:MAG TPA: DinB family protein [Blastocatellia bacterium]|nr:DinB family protein [Blastocatellia bacterium]